MTGWLAEWGYQAVFSCCSNKNAGVAILLNNNFAFQITKSYVNPEGRFIICDIIVNGKQTTLANIYAANDISKLSKKINTLFYAFLWNGKGDKVKRKMVET